MKKPVLKKLKNGMTALLVSHDAAESMTALVLTRVGSRYETKEINGASHFIEHLMFKGTTRRPSTEDISRELDRYGAEYNAYTGKDVTGYYVKMDAKHTDLAVDMLHDMIFHSTYNKEEMDRERGVIIEEINMYEDNPRMHIDDLLEAELFPGSTLGWNIAGPREVIKKVTREQLIAYRDAYYIPSRMVVVLAGKLPKDALNQLQKTFGSVKRSSGKDKAFAKFVPPKKLQKRHACQHKETEQVQFGMAFHGLKIGHKDLAAASLLSNILGGTMSSRLFIQIRERRGLCYSINASHQPLEDIGVFSIMAGLEKKRLGEAVHAIIAELKLVIEKGVTTEEVRRAKDNIRGRTTLGFEDSAAQAEWYGKQWLFQGKLESPEERMRRFEKVTPADIKRVATAIFKPGSMASAVIGPQSCTDDLAKHLTWK